METKDPATMETSQTDAAVVMSRKRPDSDGDMMVSTKASKKLYFQSAAGYYQMSSDTTDEAEMLPNPSAQLHPHVGKMVPSAQLHPHVGEMVPSTQLHPRVGEMVPSAQLHPRVGEMVPSTQLHPRVGELHTFTDSTENDAALTLDSATIAEYCEISMDASTCDQNVYVSQPSDQNVYVSQPSTEYQPYGGDLQTFPDDTERDLPSLAGYVYYEVSTSDLQALSQCNTENAPIIATQPSVGNPYTASQLHTTTDDSHEFVFQPMTSASDLHTSSHVTQENEPFTQYYCLPATEGLQTSVYTYTTSATNMDTLPTAGEYQIPTYTTPAANMDTLPTAGEYQIPTYTTPAANMDTLPTAGEYQIPTYTTPAANMDTLPTAGEYQIHANCLPTTGDLEISVERQQAFQPMVNRALTPGELQTLPDQPEADVMEYLPTAGELPIFTNSSDEKQTDVTQPLANHAHVTQPLANHAHVTQPLANHAHVTQPLANHAHVTQPLANHALSAGDQQTMTDGTQISATSIKMEGLPTTDSSNQIEATAGDQQTMTDGTQISATSIKMEGLPTTDSSNQIEATAGDQQTMTDGTQVSATSIKMEGLPTTDSSNQIEATAGDQQTMNNGTQISATSIKMEGLPTTDSSNQIEATAGRRQTMTDDSTEARVPVIKMESLPTASELPTSATRIRSEENELTQLMASPYSAAGGLQTVIKNECLASTGVIQTLQNTDENEGTQQMNDPPFPARELQTVSDGTEASMPMIKVECLPMSVQPSTNRTLPMSVQPSTNRTNSAGEPETMTESAEQTMPLIKLECLPRLSEFTGDTPLVKLECLPPAGEVQTSLENEAAQLSVGELHTGSTGDMREDAPIIKTESVPTAGESSAASEPVTDQTLPAVTRQMSTEAMLVNLPHCGALQASVSPGKDVSESAQETPALESLTVDVETLDASDEDTPMPVLERMSPIKLETPSTSGGRPTSNVSSFKCQVQGKISDKKITRNRKTRGDSRSLFTELLALKAPLVGKKSGQYQEKDVINIVSFEPGVELGTGSRLSIMVKHSSGKTHRYNYKVKESAHDAGIGTATVVMQKTGPGSRKDQRKRRKSMSASDTEVVRSEMDGVGRVDSLKMEVDAGDESLSEHEIQEAITEEEMDTNDEDDLWENWEDHDPDYDVTKDDDEESAASDDARDSKPSDLHIVKGSLRPSFSAVLPRRRNSETGSAERFEVKCTGKDMKEGLICRFTFCDETFQKWCLLTNHERSHNGLPPLPCKYCKTSLSDPEGKKVLNLDVFTCHCGKEFKEAKGLTAHAKIHSDNRPHGCEYCNKRFKTKTVLARHIRTHTGEVKYECMFCGRGFGDYSSWKRHERVHTGETPYKCDYCEQQFKQSKNLKAHVNAAHTAAEHYACETCGKSFLRKDILYSHKKSHEPKSSKRPFKCEFESCGKYYRTKRLLSDHKLIHTGIKHYKCDFCDKTFLKSGARTVHHRTHTNERPFKCDICDDAFRTKGALLQHRNIHTGSRPHKCRYCDQAFAAKSSVYNHEKMHKKEFEDPVDEKDVQRPGQRGVNAPVVKPGVNATVVKPGVNAPVVKPGVNVPVVKPDVYAPVVKPGVNAPVVKPDVYASDVEQDVNAPVVKPNVNTPVVKPDVNTPVVKSDVNAPVVKSDVNAPVVKQDVDTPVQKKNLPSRVQKPLFNVGERMAKNCKTDVRDTGDKPLVDTEKKMTVNPYVFDD